MQLFPISQFFRDFLEKWQRMKTDFVAEDIVAITASRHSTKQKIVEIAMMIRETEMERCQGEQLVSTIRTRGLTLSSRITALRDALESLMKSSGVTEAENTILFVHLRDDGSHYEATDINAIPEDYKIRHKKEWQTFDMKRVHDEYKRTGMLPSGFALVSQGVHHAISDKK